MGNEYQVALIIFCFGIVGILIAVAEGIAWTNGYVIPIFTTDASMIPGIQIMTIVLCLAIGIVFALFAKGVKL